MRASKPFQFAVGDVEEVAGTAGRVEHAEVMHAVAQFVQALECLRIFNLLAPRLDDRRPDNFHDVGRAGEMRAEGMAFFVVHRMLEERAENFGLNFGPVERGGFAEQDEVQALESPAVPVRETGRR